MIIIIVKKLEDYIKFIELSFYLDFKHIHTKDNIYIQCKNKKYNEEQYCEIICIKKEDSFIYLCDKKKLKEDIIRLIKDYIKYTT